MFELMKTSIESDMSVIAGLLKHLDKVIMEWKSGSSFYCANLHGLQDSKSSGEWKGRVLYTMSATSKSNFVNYMILRAI